VTHPEWSLLGLPRQPSSAYVPDMGLMDKVKAQAEQAVAKAQHGVAQGQSKLEEIQAKKRADALLRNLGAAYYAQQRSGGSAEAVTTALTAVDAHAAENGTVDTTASVNLDET
jgi:anthranilate phosphoribosyltransferase